MELTEKQRLPLIVELFNQLFCDAYATELVGGAQEPLYSPSTSTDRLHRVLFRENYISSALHEVAHWCIAGSHRLQQQDYGYWYQPDGRTALEQRQFETVEIKPQALEWMFSTACGQRFRLSADNLTASGDDLGASQQFKCAVVEQALDWCHNAQLPPRAKQFIDGLVDAFAVHNPYDSSYYQIDFLH
jgi:elongation factor P hydroxylase